MIPTGPFGDVALVGGSRRRKSCYPRCSLAGDVARDANSPCVWTGVDCNGGDPHDGSSRHCEATPLDALIFEMGNENWSHEPLEVSDVTLSAHL
jgi:hypothetical protein